MHCMTPVTTTPLKATQVAAITALLGSTQIRTPQDLAALDPGIDPHNFGACLLVRPGSTAEVAAVLAYCHAERIPVVPQGGRTGLSGGAITQHGQVALSLERLDRIEVLDADQRSAVVGAGVKLGVLAAKAAAVGLSPGIDLGARDSATLGGLVSTNAGGNEAFRYGTMRERVLGLECVLADGTVITELGQVRKRNEGLAVERLLIGAEGTLGVVTRVALELVPARRAVATAVLALESLTQAVSLARHLRTPALVALELMSGNHALAVVRSLGLPELAPLAAHPWLVLVEVEAPSSEQAESTLVELLGTASEQELLVDALLAMNAAQRHAMWRLREDWAVDRERPGGLWYDISVPLSAMADYVARVIARVETLGANLEVFVIGHLADGNLHVTVNAPHPVSERYEAIAPLVTDELTGLGGSFSAEHGIGVEKQATLLRLVSPAKLALMQAVKRAYDPHGIMNPGKVLPTAPVAPSAG
jgi:FAD/FMN-containing dehydrogenase